MRVLPLKRARMSSGGGVLKEELAVRRERVVAVRVFAEGNSLTFRFYSVLRVGRVGSTWGRG